jgi:hypothetical protein
MTTMHRTSSRRLPLGSLLRRAVVVVAIVASLLAGLFVAAPATAATDDAPWDVATVDGVLGSGRQNYDYAVEPGDRLEDAFLVVNHGTVPIDLALYAADAFTTDAGQLDLRTHDVAPVGVGAWVRLGLDSVSLQPGQSTEVPFTITVPDAASDGSRIGGVVTTPVSAPNGTEAERRVAIQIDLRVGDGFEPRLSVEDLQVGYSGEQLGAGLATVTYTVRNAGDTVLAAEQSIDVAGPFDAFRVEAASVDPVPSLLPGETWRVSVPVRGVAPTGVLAATVTLVPLYTDAAGSTGPLATVEQTGNGWAVPWLAVLMIVALALAIVAIVIIWKRGALPRRD